MNNKKNILILCDWFLPGYLAGGPIQSIATLTAHLSGDVNFKIITTDRDFKSDKPYQNITINAWTEYQGRQVFYVSPENLNPEFLLQLIQQTPHDTLYLNSLFSKWFTIFPLKWKRDGLINSRIVLAPRGMLRDAALAVKPLKKQLFLRYAKWFGLFKNIHWQSTSAQETQEIIVRIGKGTRCTEVPNLPDFEIEYTSLPKTPNELRLCFVARIVDIKNLNYAITILKPITQGQITFDIYGPKEDPAYWDLCEANSKNLPGNIAFEYKGIMEPQQIAETLQAYHALLLPTQTENFGHVIVQSLQSGRPVIISNNTPWKNLQARNAGFDLDLNEPQQFTEAVSTLLHMNQASFNELSNGSLQYLNNTLSIDVIKEQYKQLFN